MEQLGSIAKKKFANKAATAAFVCNVFKKATGRTGGRSLANVIKELSFKDGCVTVFVSDGAGAQEIRLRSSEIIRESNKDLGGDLISRINFKAK